MIAFWFRCGRSSGDVLARAGKVQARKTPSSGAPRLLLRGEGSAANHTGIRMVERKAPVNAGASRARSSRAHHVCAVTNRWSMRGLQRLLVVAHDVVALQRAMYRSAAIRAAAVSLSAMVSLNAPSGGPRIPQFRHVGVVGIAQRRARRTTGASSRPSCRARSLPPAAATCSAVDDLLLVRGHLVEQRRQLRVLHLAGASL